jgi:hypothetical protein
LCAKKAVPLCDFFRGDWYAQGKCTQRTPQINTVILVIHLPLFERLPVFRKKCTVIIPHFPSNRPAADMLYAKRERSVTLLILINHLYYAQSRYKSSPRNNSSWAWRNAYKKEKFHSVSSELFMAQFIISQFVRN